VGGGYAGYDLDILESMAAELNFTLHYILEKDLRRENESNEILWRGLFGPWNVVLIRIESGEIDIGVGHFILTPQRIRGLSFTTTYFQDKTQFYATKHLIFSTSIDDWLLAFIAQTLVVHSVLALATHFVRMRYKRPSGGFGETAIMVRIFRFTGNLKILIVECAFENLVFYP